MPMGVGYGAAMGLQDVLAQKFREQLEKQRIREQMDAFNLQRQQQQQVQDRWMTDRTDRQGEAAANQAGFNAYVGGLPEHLRGTVAGRQFGVNVSLSPEDFVNPPETREAAAARNLAELRGELQTRQEFRDPSLVWTTRPDGSQVRVADAPGITSARPVAANLSMIDPTFPPAVQAQILGLRSQHPTFDAALAAANAQLPAWMQANPRLSPSKVMDALRQSYAGGGQRDPFDDLMAEVLGDMGGAGTGRMTAAGPRASGGAPAGDAALQQAAAKVLQQNGYDPTPENVATFLANPQNRVRLAGGGQ
jgi:hypothetical protein